MSRFENVWSGRVSSWLNPKHRDDGEVLRKDPHLLLIEITQGEWRNRSARARAHAAQKVLKHLGYDTRNMTGAEAKAWLEKKENQ